MLQSSSFILSRMLLAIKKWLIMSAINFKVFFLSFLSFSELLQRAFRDIQHVINLNQIVISALIILFITTESWNDDTCSKVICSTSWRGWWCLWFPNFARAPLMRRGRFLSFHHLPFLVFININWVLFRTSEARRLRQLEFYELQCNGNGWLTFFYCTIMALYKVISTTSVHFSLIHFVSIFFFSFFWCHKFIK